MDYEVFEETERGRIPGRVHYVERNTRSPALCGLSQVDKRVQGRFVALMLPLNLPDGIGFEAVSAPKCGRCSRLRARLIEC